MKKYLHVIGIGVQNNLTYRVNYLTRTLFSFIPLFAMIALWQKMGGAEHSGWTLAETDTLRTLSKDAHEMVTISYDAVPHWSALVTLHNLQYDYRLVIRSVAEAP